MAEATVKPVRARLPIAGMTCASCAARIERRLNKLEGVEASVNYAAEEATAIYDPARVVPGDLVRAVEAAGYRVRAEHQHDEGEAVHVLQRRLVAAIALTVPVALLAMVPPLQFAGWQWVAGVLATPVVFWSGWQFHRGALQNLRPRRWTR